MTTTRIPERVVQSQIRAALLAIGAKVYTIGRPPRKDAVFKGTGQTAGIPDMFAFLPLRGGVGPSAVWIEVKAKGGRLRPEQAEFAALCAGAGIPHLVGGLDVVLAYLQQHGYVRETAHYRKGAA
jgi:hypothetical protein